MNTGKGYYKKINQSRGSEKNISPVISQKNIVGLPTSILVSAIYFFNAEKVIPTVNYHYQLYFYPILPFVIFAYTVL